MPSRGFLKPDPLERRVKVQFTATQEQALHVKADGLGMTIAAYVRQLVLADLEPGTVKAPSDQKSRQRSTMLLAAELHALAMQVKKLGTNVNQLSKQANTGMVPLTRAEVTYLLNQHQVLMSHVSSSIEKLLA